jgi:hypothetical protein
MMIMYYSTYKLAVNYHFLIGYSFISIEDACESSFKYEW